MSLASRLRTTDDPPASDLFPLCLYFNRERRKNTPASEREIIAGYNQREVPSRDSRPFVRLKLTMDSKPIPFELANHVVRDTHSLGSTPRSDR